MTDRINVEVEVRAAVDGPMLRGVILAEGRAARGGRAELFAPGAVCWPADGIAILAEHRGRELARVLPTREANGEIRIETRATDDIRRAVDVDGRRFLSVEFFAHRETLRTLTKINLSSLAVCGLFGFYAAQRGTGGHDCRQVRGGVAGIG